MSHVIDWDGENVPPALESLPPGRYVIERLDESLALDKHEEEGIRQALASLEAGRGSTLEEVQERVLKKLGDR
jgi:predicted transcriptional regulator